MSGHDPREFVERPRELLRAVSGRELPADELEDRAVELARTLLPLCEALTEPRDREQLEVLGRMMNDERGQVFTTFLTDRVYRSRSKKRVVEQARYLLEWLGPPAYLGSVERLGLHALSRVGSWVPTLSGTTMQDRIQHETSAFVLPAEPDALGSYLAARRAAGTSVNLNHLGEEVLGEAEAERRIQGYVEMLQRPGVETISVKISSIWSQNDPLTFASSERAVAERLQRIYRTALAHPRADGRPKLVMLDMEAYRDAELTLAALQRALVAPDLHALNAGVALQAYLPDSVAMLRRLIAWSRARVNEGGGAVRVRLVKGANLAAERVESELRGWPCPIFENKALVDRNFKRLLLEALAVEPAAALELGIASHNLFDLSFALVACRARGRQNVAFELLEGMANPLRRALRALEAPVLVYAPIVGEDEFPSAIAYLARRLDENTSRENYLRHSFSMQLDSPEWQQQETLFRAACRDLEELPSAPRRTQDRRLPPPAPTPGAEFANEPDTDFILAHNREWQVQWLERVQHGEFRASSQIAGQHRLSNDPEPGFDPSRPGHVPYLIDLASEQDVEVALDCATRVLRAGTIAGSSDAETRRGWLRAGAGALRAARAELVALMLLDAGKRVEEADVEVSEAIDFAEYYWRCHAELDRDLSVRSRSRGPVVVTPPWNFPLAIPLGGVFAALVAGNPVILKPALETPLVARRACELLWDSGVPLDWLQLVLCRDEVASRLITDPRTQMVVLTGSTQTARLFHQLRPEIELLAETGGKNALFVSAMSDREQAIGDIVASAFGHSGQKCSALSQLILEREVYEDPAFLDALADATRSLKVGSAWELDSFVTPLIQPPSALQRRASSDLDEGERWLVQPVFDLGNPRLVSPGIRLGVRPGSFSHQTEFFCPVLSVLCADDLNHALDIANATPYGLTAGIHSLDEREQAAFIEGITAGNVYVNRRITGAIVQRQPFGGWKASNFGSGVKAGGPNYVAQFVELEPTARELETAPPAREPELPKAVSDLLETLAPHLARLDPSAGLEPMAGLDLEPAAYEYVRSHTRWFASAHDPSRIRGEDNWLRYRPLSGLFVWVDERMSVTELASIALAASVTSCPLEIHTQPDVPAAPLAQALGGDVLHDDLALASALESTAAERVRSAALFDAPVLEIARRRGLHVETRRSLLSGRYDLLHSLREQAVSVRYHRYGHLGLRQEP